MCAYIDLKTQDQRNEVCTMNKARYQIYDLSEFQENHALTTKIQFVEVRDWIIEIKDRLEKLEERIAKLEE